MTSQQNLGTADTRDEAEDDPFLALAQNVGYGRIRDPYPAWHEERARCPVQVRDMRTMMGVPEHIELPEMPPGYQLIGFDTVCDALMDGRTFSSSAYAESMGLVMGHTILEMDEPEHQRHRAVIQQAFTKKALSRWETDLVEPIVQRCIDKFAGRGRADLISELTFPFPVMVIAGLLGLPEEDMPQFHRWSAELISISFDIDKGFAASQKLRDYFAGLLDERRANPRDDLISALAHAEKDGLELTDDEIFAFLRLLLPAGAETTYRSSTNLFFGLLTHPDQLEEVRADRTLVPAAIEEGLRWEPPLTGILRKAASNVEVAGVTIAAGSQLSICLGAANRDPDRWSDPDRFDIHRKPQQHMAFGFGVHTCLGIHLARMESRVVVNAVLDRLRGLRLDPEVEDVHIGGMGFRSPQRLPVLFEPA